MGQECLYRTGEGSQVQATRARSPSLPGPRKHPPPPALAPLGRQELHHLPGASCSLTARSCPPWRKPWYALSLRGILLDPAKRVPPCSALEVDPDCSPLPLVPRDPWMRPPGGGVVGHSRCPSEDRKPRLPSLGQEVKILTAGMTGERVTHPWVVRHLCWQVWESPLQLAGFPTLEAC